MAVREHIVRVSTFFAELVSSVQGVGGHSVLSPIRLAGVHRHQFACLLAAIERLSSDDSGRTSSPLSAAYWEAILPLAHRWNFAGIRELAQEEVNISKMNDVDKVLFGLEHGYTEMVVRTYVALAHREVPLSVEEAHRLGLERAVILNTLREEIRRSPRNQEPQDLEARVRNVFQLGVSSDVSMNEALGVGASALAKGKEPENTGILSRRAFARGDD